MDRYEYNIILEKLNKLVEEKDYTTALGLVEEVDWKRVRNTRTLIMVSEIYEKNERLEDAKDILLLAYERTTVGRSILYRLVEVAIALGSLDEALEYYMEYSLLYPNEAAKYILKYKVWRARGSSVEEQIQALEAYKEQEYNEKWIYELAKLYEENQQEDKAIAMCDEVILWFSDGEFVQKSMELKKRYTTLSPQEEMKYREVLVKEQLSGDNFLDDACDPEELEPIEGRVLDRPKDDHDNESEDLEVLTESSYEDKQQSDQEVVQDEDKVEIDLANLEDKIIQESMEEAAKAESSEKSIVDILNEHAQKNAASKASSIELQLEEGVLETIQETQKKQALLEEETRKNREELSEAISMEEIEALVEESEARKAEERIALSNPKDYEDMPIEQDVSEDLEELANLLKVKEESVEDITIDLTATDAIGLDDYIPGQLSFDKLLAEMNQKEETNATLQEVVEESLLESVNEIVEEVAEENSNINETEGILDIGVGLEDFLNSLSKVELATSEVEQENVDLPIDDSSLSEDEQIEDETTLEDLTLDEISEVVSKEPVEEISEEAVEDHSEEEIEENIEVVQEPLEVDLEKDLKDSEDEQIDLNIGLEDFLVNLMQEESKDSELGDNGDSIPDIKLEDTAPLEESISLEDLDLDFKEEKSEIIEIDLEELVNTEKKTEIDVIDFSAVLDQEVAQLMSQEEGLEVKEPKTDPLVIEESQPLTEEQTRMLSYFAPIPGISDQVSQVLSEVRRKGYDAKTSHQGNVIVMGRQGCGKTTLATNVLKAIEKEKGKDTFRIANISATDLNQMEVAEVIEKIGGGGLIIEQASQLTDKTIQDLSLAMNMRTDGLTVILEDDKRNMKAVLSEHEDFASKFTSQIVIPVFTNDELVEFAKSYADENGYDIDEMGILALYNRIGLSQSEDKPVAVADVKEMVDYAMDSAESKAFGLFCGLFQKRDKEDRKGILLEKHFEK